MYKTETHGRNKSNYTNNTKGEWIKESNQNAGIFELGIKLKMLSPGDSLQIRMSEWIKVITRKLGVPL